MKHCETIIMEGHHHHHTSSIVNEEELVGVRGGGVESEDAKHPEPFLGRCGEVPANQRLASYVA